uniref:Secreted protein n=1 Tax=Angiostrongylus cantonensis TaxID=6313 RepID=A0A0K0DHY9_ANGCA
MSFGCCCGWVFSTGIGWPAVDDGPAVGPELAARDFTTQTPSPEALLNQNRVSSTSTEQARPLLRITNELYHAFVSLVHNAMDKNSSDLLC